MSAWVGPASVSVTAASAPRRAEGARRRDRSGGGAASVGMNLRMIAGKPDVGASSPPDCPAERQVHAHYSGRARYLPAAHFRRRDPGVMVGIRPSSAARGRRKTMEVDFDESAWPIVVARWKRSILDV